MIIALVIILLLFGAKRIPELARGLGSGVKEFRAGTREGQLEEKKEDEKSAEAKADEAKSEEVKAEEAQTATAGDETRLEDESPVEAENTQQKRG